METPKNNGISYFAESDYRNKNTKFGIKQEDRTRHVYVIGKTGMGKSTLLENMAVQDIQDGNGLAFIDPHGKTAELLLDYVPEERINDVLYFAPFDLEHPISFNVMEDVGSDKRHLVANGLMSAFKKIWVDMWSARMEYILNNTLLALLEYPDSTLIGVNRMLGDKRYRDRVVDNITDVSVRSFWVDEFAKYGDRYMQEAGASIQNKIGQFISSPLVRNIVGQPESSFDVRKIMDERKIMIINLSKGRIGEDNANLVGSMLITKMYLSAMSRADAPPEKQGKFPNFYFYVDEFQSFANESFANILSEARKYNLNLTIAHQYIEQMTDEVRAAVFGNVGTLISFRVGATDAEYLEKEFAPEFTAEDLVNLGFAQIYLKLMIDGVSSHPFSARTLPPITQPEQSFKDLIIQRSRKSFARPRAFVEEEIIKWHQNPAGLIKDDYEREQSLQQGKQSGSKKNNENRAQSSKGRKKKKGKGGKKDRETRLREAMSLQQLEKKDAGKSGKSKTKDKNPSEQNVNELRGALASVLKDTVNEIEKSPGNDGNGREEKDEKGSENNSGKFTEKRVENSRESGDEKKEEKSPNEVPEDVLRKMLSVEEEKK